MLTSLTVENLRSFQDEVSDLFLQKKIRAPIHLERNNEQQLIDIFKYVKQDDWVCATWRSQLKHALKGVPLDLLKQKILEGKSIGLCFPEYRTVSSAIVAGILPIALGLAYSIKEKGEKNRVWVFVGDATSLTGCFTECYTYAVEKDLPLIFVLENNHKSVCTPTKAMMGREWPMIFDDFIDRRTTFYLNFADKVVYYSYNMEHNHAGPFSGERVQF